MGKGTNLLSIRKECPVKWQMTSLLRKDGHCTASTTGRYSGQQTSTENHGNLYSQSRITVQKGKYRDKSEVYLIQSMGKEQQYHFQALLGNVKQVLSRHQIKFGFLDRNTIPGCRTNEDLQTTRKDDQDQGQEQ